VDLKRQAQDLLDRHGAGLYRLLVRLTLRADVAEDLLQELAVSLLSTEPWRQARDPAAYVFRMAIHLAFRWRKREARREAAELPAELGGPEESPVDRLVDAENRQRLLAALDELPELSRQCLVLRYLREESPESIAGQLGKTAHQVRALCSKGVAALRARLASPSCVEKGGEHA
jgi:RNA polymerase sigma factor (sigma-70 family)